MDITSLTIKEMRSKLDSREISSPELTKAYIDRIFMSFPRIVSVS